MENITNTTNPNVKKVRLPFWTCVFIEADSDIRNNTFPTTDPNKVYLCDPLGEFYVGRSDHAQAVGHAICVTLVILIALVGLVGVVTNVLSMLIVPRSMKKLSGSLSDLLVILGFFELLTAASAIGFSSTVIIIMENVDRSAATLTLRKVIYAFYTFGRVAFIYTAILVSIERYIVVTFPAKVNSLLSPLMRKLYFIPVVIIAFLTFLPLILSESVEENTDALISLPDFPYLYMYTEAGKGMYPWFTYYGQLIIKTFIPVPLLLIFNGLLYRTIKRWKLRRKSLTTCQKREINAATMLTTSVLLVMFWNLPYYLAFMIELVVQDKHTYREVQFLKIFCVTASTTINFAMYFRHSGAFKKEVLKYLRLSNGQDENHDRISVTGTCNS